MDKQLPLTLPKGITKSLSFKQPFAWLIANGYLLVDDRSWATDYRGPILIHASKGLYETYYDHLFHHTDIPLPARDQLEFGGVVGMANLILCAQSHKLPADLHPTQRAHFKNVHGDSYGLLFDQAQPLPLMPCRGQLKIFELDFDALQSAPPPAQSRLF